MIDSFFFQWKILGTLFLLITGQIFKSHQCLYLLVFLGLELCENKTVDICR